MKSAVPITVRPHPSSKPLKAVLFDMDGVLFDSMPAHAKAWYRAMVDFGFDFSVEEAYMHEGRTGFGTIQIIATRQGRSATREDADEVYRIKSRYFAEYPPAEPMPGAWELLQKLQEQGILIVLVTGSGTQTLLDRLNRYYPGIFVPERMVTAFDVQYGKPNPEPYLIGLSKIPGISAEECLVVENAPLGVQAAVAAGIPTIAVNTGPLPDEVLLQEGASWLFPSMQSLSDHWSEFFSSLYQ